MVAPVMVAPAPTVIQPSTGVQVQTNLNVERLVNLNNYGQFIKFKQFIEIACSDKPARNNWQQWVDPICQAMFVVALPAAQQLGFLTQVTDWADLNIREVERLLIIIFPTANAVQGTKIDRQISNLTRKDVEMDLRDNDSLPRFWGVILGMFMSHEQLEASLKAFNPQYVSTIHAQIKALLSRMKAISNQSGSPQHTLNTICRDLETLRDSEADSPVFNNIRNFLSFVSIRFSKMAEHTTFVDEAQRFN